MEKQINIQVPEGFEIDKEKSTFETIIFKEIKKSESDKNKEMSDFLFEMFNKCEQRFTGEKEFTFYKGNKWIYQQDYKNGCLWVRYSLVWAVFEEKFNLNYRQIKDFIASWVETNTEWKGLTPERGFPDLCIW